MDGMAGTKSSLTWTVHISVALLVALWLFPTVGLFVSSFRTADQISGSGWWAAMFPAEQNEVLRAADPDENRTADGDAFVVSGNIFAEAGDEPGSKIISVWGTSSRAISAYQPGETADLGDGETMALEANGDYVWRGNDDQISGRGQRLFVTAEAPPEFTVSNYDTILRSGSGNDNMARAFFATLTVTIPATIIPIVVAAFAAYALAWMDFPGRALLVAVVVGLLVVPLQLALIPLLRLHLGIGIGKGIWAFGSLTPHSACRSPSTSCATTWSGCRATSSRTPRSMVPPIFRSSPRSSCRCPSRRWPPSPFSSFSGLGTTFWSHACSWSMRPAIPVS